MRRKFETLRSLTLGSVTLRRRYPKAYQERLLLKQRRPMVTDKKALARGLALLLMLGAFLTGIILFYVWTRVEVVKLNYSILEVSKEERRLFIKNERLRVELAELITPSRLSYLAKKDLNLKDPTQQQIIYMK